MTDRLARLRAGFETAFRAGYNHLLTDEVEDRWVADLVWRSYRATRGQPEVARKAAFLQAFAEEFPIHLWPDERIVGSQRFAAWGRRPGVLTPEQRREAEFHGNLGHVVVDYGRVLQRGVAGLRQDLARMPRTTPAQQCNAAAFEVALTAFSRFIARHAEAAREAAANGALQDDLRTIAEACAWLAEAPPRSFPEALQLLWFIQIFLHAEGGAAAVSFGRLDQYLWPYLERDLAAGAFTMPQVAEWLGAFFLKCGEGDESQNLVCGGVDASGRGADNLLSVLCLQVMRELRVWQPSLSVRLGPETSSALWEAALELCAAGGGMPAFFNDPVVTRALTAAGIPCERARDWAIVGCYEAVPQGDCLPLTVAGYLSLPNAFLDFLATPEAGAAADFAAFLAALRAFLARYYLARLAEFEQQWQRYAVEYPSPFESLCLSGCLTSGLVSAEGGARFNLFGVNILGLGTLLDSLLAVRALVYERRQLPLAALTAQLAADFADERLLQQCRALPGKYGSDDPFSNRLAGELSAFVADLVLGHPFGNGVRPYPGFFRFSGDIYASIPATPDGRRGNDRISYGVAPGIHGPAPAPTALLNAAAHVAHDRCACGNPLTLSLPRADVAGPAGMARLRQLIEGYFAGGGFHLHFNVTDAAQLRRAQEHPEEYRDLTIRISGYSARFTTLDRRWQDALIERTAKGM